MDGSLWYFPQWCLPNSGFSDDSLSYRLSSSLLHSARVLPFWSAGTLELPVASCGAFVRTSRLVSKEQTLAPSTFSERDLSKEIENPMENPMEIGRSDWEMPREIHWKNWVTLGGLLLLEVPRAFWKKPVGYLFGSLYFVKKNSNNFGSWSHPPEAAVQLRIWHVSCQVAHTDLIAGERFFASKNHEHCEACHERLFWTDIAIGGLIAPKRQLFGLFRPFRQIASRSKRRYQSFYQVSHSLE